MNSLRIFVPGVPQAKGSKIALGRGHMIEAGTSKSRVRKKSWAISVREAVREALIGRVISTAVEIEAVFLFPIPVSRRRGKNALASGDKHVQKPDGDKLLRNLYDPIKDAGLLKDDCIISDGTHRKRWCEAGNEGASVLITW